MQTRNLFKTAVLSVWRNKTSVIPVLLYLLFLLLLGMAFLHHSGLLSVVADVTQLAQSGAAEARIEAYVQQWIQSTEWSDILDISVLAGAYFVGWFVISLYLNSALFVTLAMFVTDRFALSTAFREAWYYVPKLFGMKLVWTSLFLLAGIVAFALAMLFMLLHPLVGIVGLFLLFLSLLAFTLFVFVKFVFPVPRMFVEEDAVVESFRNSYELTNGRFVDALLVCAIVYGIALIANSFVGNPVVSMFGSLIRSNTFVEVLLYAVFLLVLLLLYSFAITVADAYRFFACQSFKDE